MYLCTGRKNYGANQSQDLESTFTKKMRDHSESLRLLTHGHVSAVRPSNKLNMEHSLGADPENPIFVHSSSDTDTAQSVPDTGGRRKRFNFQERATRAESTQESRSSLTKKKD